MTPESKQALDKAVKAAGSQIALCRTLDLPQSNFWTWQRGSGPTPAIVSELVAITHGKVTADQFRRDSFGWLAPINDYLVADLTPEAKLAAIDLTWHQITEDDAEDHLTARGYTTRRARKVMRELQAYDANGAAA